MDSREKGLLKTLLYADIFNHPLKKEEIFKFFISNEKLDKKVLSQVLKNSGAAHKNNYYFINGRTELIKKRKNREKISKLKIAKAKKIIKKIGIVPSVKLIAISGALSMKNAEKEDDIDIFVVTQEKLVWATRLFLILALSFMGVYRRRNAKITSDKICLNMIVGENAMRFKKIHQNLYIAHEIFQMIPVFERDNTYYKFINANNWANSFLPNAFASRVRFIKKKTTLMDKCLIFLLKTLFWEKIFRFLQLEYMSKHITTERVENNFLGFHPFDYQTYVLKLYRKRLKEHGLTV